MEIQKPFRAITCISGQVNREVLVVKVDSVGRDTVFLAVVCDGTRRGTFITLTSEQIFVDDKQLHNFEVAI